MDDFAASKPPFVEAFLKRAHDFANFRDDSGKRIMSQNDEMALANELLVVRTQTLAEVASYLRDHAVVLKVESDAAWSEDDYTTGASRGGAAAALEGTATALTTPGWHYTPDDE